VKHPILCLLAMSLASVVVLHSACGFDFRKQLKPVTMMQYDHHHIQKNEVTGYTKIEIKTTVKEGKTFFLAVDRNLDRQGKVFTEKQTVYDAASGDLVTYSESDFRTGTTISSKITGTTILTQVRSGSEQLDIALQLETDIVPFEVLPLYLQKSLPGLRDKGKLVFTLYLPVVAIELKRKGMPVSLSKIEMEARVVETRTVETVLGVQPVIRIVLKPLSLLINAFLPEEKTAFYFTFLAAPPHTLLSFRENQTESVLTIVNP